MTGLTLEAIAERLDRLERQVNRLLPSGDDPPGTEGDTQRTDPESIDRWLAEFAAIPPAVMTAEEEAAWQAARLARNEADVARIDRLAAGLSGTPQ